MHHRNQHVEKQHLFHSSLTRDVQLIIHGTTLQIAPLLSTMPHFSMVKDRTSSQKDCLFPNCEVSYNYKPHTMINISTSSRVFSLL